MGTTAGAPGGGSRRTEALFRTAMVVKGVDGAAELLGALFLLLVPGAAIHRLVADVLAHDLLGPPDGTLARHLSTAADEFTSGRPTFAVVYLALHGVVKLGLVAALLRKWLPAYPVAVVVLGLFVVYELYRAVRTGSLVLPLLAVLDIAVIVVVVREYRTARSPR
ncbi:DUF2127 domain-containing protein [Umezawaea sp. Da 62-37]|uniref:DUF2127 domain-containing protein n=1 Tax=Umezawaea sp. Da 62-37 TaxID=3075927 RepID=UPI0028F6EE2A|nr:DUF2127 domain-containing protein [Umezawaea sp. Da 62-37]WNV86040.1 DUF2127 domain-containing protein [Umezawaea sp. Da 62-37]